MAKDHAPQPVPVVHNDSVTQGHVILPFGKEEFRDFIQSLLGAPQSITRHLSGSFELNREDIVSFHHVLMQRITQQNEASLIQFRTKISFNDNSSVNLGSLPELQTYNEVRPVVARSVHMTWDLLVRFPEKLNPERQTVSLSIVRDFDDLPEGYMSIDDLEEGPYAFQYMAGQFALRIDHTARTFGADIEALLTGHIKSFIRSPSALVLRLQAWGRSVGGYLIAMTIVFLSVALILAARRHAAALDHTYEQLRIAGADANAQALFMLKASYTGTWATFAINAGAICAILLMLVWGVASQAWRHVLEARPSVFMLTPKSADFRERLRKKYQRGWIRFAMSCVVALLLNLIASFIFTRLYP